MLRRIIHPPLIKRVYAECNLLFQLIKLIIILKVDPNDQILKKVKLKTHSYIGFGFNVTQMFLSQYNLTCTLNNNNIKILYCRQLSIYIYKKTFKIQIYLYK